MSAEESAQTFQKGGYCVIMEDAVGLTSDPRVGSACWLIFGAAAYSTDIYQVWGTALGAGDRTGIAKLDKIPVLAEHKV